MHVEKITENKNKLNVVSKCFVSVFDKTVSLLNGVSTFEASDSITDRARGLVGKRGDTAMRDLFFHLNKKFGKIIKKTWQYMLNVIPHIFSPINICVIALVFFYNRKKPYFLKVRNQSIFYN